MRILQIILPEGTVDRLSDEDLPSFRAAHRCGFVWGPDGDGGLRSPALEETTALLVLDVLRSTGLAFEERDLTVEYRFGETLAAAASRSVTAQQSSSGPGPGVG